MKIISPDCLSPYINELNSLLINCVDENSSIGFIPPVSQDEANHYWQGVNQRVTQGFTIAFIAIKETAVIGCVQLSLVNKANGLHRAEVEKLIVSPKARGTGIAESLMKALESKAASLGRSLLVLDTRKGDAASYLYKKLGYIEAGEIPHFALSADNKLHSTLYFYKELKSHPV